MLAWHLREAPGEYSYGEVDGPPVGDEEVLVRVRASALNHMDLWLSRGRPSPPRFPHVPGGDVAGVVEAVGSMAGHWRVGDDVVVDPTVVPTDAESRLGVDSPLDPAMQILGEHRWGGHGELLSIPARNLVHRPAGRSWAECCAYPVAGVTAWRMLRRARLQEGESVLVVGIGGGVSTAALVIARHLGATVYATSRSSAKRQQALELGAADAFDSLRPYPVQADVVIESVGPATWDQSMKSLRPGGRLVVCGGTSGSMVELSLPRLFFKQYEIIGSTMGSHAEFVELTGLITEGLPVLVDREFPVREYPAALDRLARGDQLGKIVLDHR